jgi:hypothetical protein
MTQALYAHMNNKKVKIKESLWSLHYYLTASYRCVESKNNPLLKCPTPEDADQIEKKL